MIISDYCFIDRYGKVLAEESLPADQVAGFAQRLARKHQTTVHIWIAAGEPVQPDKCPDCGQILPESGPCWHNRFEFEAPADSIPFEGEAYPAPAITESDTYF